jgi:hypothetical protein
VRLSAGLSNETSAQLEATAKEEATAGKNKELRQTKKWEFDGLQSNSPVQKI